MWADVCGGDAVVMAWQVLNKVVIVTFDEEAGRRIAMLEGQIRAHVRLYQLVPGGLGLGLGGLCHPIAVPVPLH
jgi:hypothetical protein